MMFATTLRTQSRNHAFFRYATVLGQSTTGKQGIVDNNINSNMRRPLPFSTMMATQSSGGNTLIQDFTWNSVTSTPTQVVCFSSTASGNAEEKESKAKAETETTEGAEPEAEPETEAEAVETEEEKERERLEAEIKGLKDQLLRSYAEQENTRNIAKRDVSEARQFAIKSFAKSLLEVADNLQRALDTSASAAEGSKDSAQQQLASLVEGVAMTNNGLTKALESHGVKKFCDVPGEKFNPELHNALMQYPDPSKEPETVGQVIKAGYTLNDRVLRPAEVGVIQKS